MQWKEENIDAFMPLPLGCVAVTRVGGYLAKF